MWPFTKQKKTTIEQIDKKRLEHEAVIKQQQAAAAKQAKAAAALGRHYTEWVEPVKELKRKGKLDEAERILLACVAATEREDEITKWGVAPWYYEQLAIVYRGQGRIDDEIKILQRYDKLRHGKGEGANKLSSRLEKAIQLKRTKHDS